MSVLLACTECGRKLKVPETALGKKVKCPSCSAQFVAAEPDEAPAAAKATPPPRTNPDGLTDRPAPRRAPGDGPAPRREAPPKKSGPPLLLILGILGGVFVLCAGVLGVGGFFVYRAVSKTGEKVRQSVAEAKQAIEAANNNKGPGPGMNPMQADGIPDAEWRDFAPAGGRFSARFPGTPAPAPLVGPGSVTKYMLQRPHENKVFVVLYSDAPDAPDPQGTLQLAANLERDNLVRATRGAPVVDKAITLGAYPGREFQIRTGREFFISRLFFVRAGKGGRLYQLMIGGPGIKPDAGDAARFFNSFKIEAPPTPTPGGAPPPPPPPAGNQTADWKLFRPPQGFCVVEMPGTPALQKDPNNPDLVAYGVEKGSGHGYALSWFKVTPQDGANADFLGKLGIQVRDSLLKDHGGKVLALRVIRGTVPCREIQIEARDKTLIVTRLYLAKVGTEDRVYQLAVTGQNLTPNSAEVTRFLNSFKVSRPRRAPPAK
jgi:hypothetical protein